MPLRYPRRICAAGCQFQALDGRKISFPWHASEAIRFALSHSEFVFRDLPGDLDDAGKLALVRRLIREGLVVAFAT